jgi:hypothetical protein
LDHTGRLPVWEKRAMESEDTPRKAGKCTGQHYSTTEMCAFADIHSHIKAVRKNKYSLLWEQHFQQHIKDETSSNELRRKADTDDHCADQDVEVDIPMDYSDEEC